MSDDSPKGFDKLKYWWFRALGYSDTQARWQLRRSPKEPEQHRELKFKNCSSCQHLMLVTDHRCVRCGQGHYLPSWWLKLSHNLNVSSEAVIPFIVALCLFGYLIQIKLGGSLMGGVGGDPEVSRRILILGASLPMPLSEHLSPQYAWRLFTYTLMHGNLMHIAFNLVALFQIGPLVARTFGFSRTLLIWVVSGAGAILLPALIFPKTGLTIGASGSVFGLIGVAMVFGHRVGTAQGRFIRNKMIEWTVFCTLFGFMMGGVAHSAHFGGLITGGIFSYLIKPPRTELDHFRSALLFLPSLLFIIWSLWAGYEVYEAISLY